MGICMPTHRWKKVSSFEGVTTGEGCVSAWLTNTTDFQVYVDAGEAIAFWEADIDGEFELRAQGEA